MASLREQVVRVVLRNGVVTGIEDVNDSFRRLTVAAEARWSPGDKVQLWIGGARFRTYTPFAWDDGSVSFLVYRHGPSPATTWADGVAVDQTLYFRGPRGSVNLASLDRAPIFVGDETSFALAASCPIPAVEHIFEATTPTSSEEALAHLALPNCTLIPRRPDDAHHEDLCALVLDTVRRQPDAPLVLTGKSLSIKAIRQTLKQSPVSPTAPTARVKTYWDPNRTALD
jgi:NADPH-dependent ferric siderophore reductase